MWMCMGVDVPVGSGEGRSGGIIVRVAIVIWSLMIEFVVVVLIEFSCC